MQVFSVNDVKIYNLSAGKSVPEWMNSEARRKAERSVDARRRVQLIQDFEMPDVSHTVNLSKDGRYVFATGAYKSWLKCYDLENLALKFQRGLDSSVIKLVSLGDDYSKIILLQEDRFLEIHAAFGRYFRMRMPRYGRDMAYSLEQSDLYLVGASLPKPTNYSYAVSVMLSFFLCSHKFLGTADCQLEAWDHRDKSRVGVLDCLPCLRDETGVEVEITSLKFRDSLLLGVGTSSGHVLLYDIRSCKPLIVKNHLNGLSIRKIDFVSRCLVFCVFDLLQNGFETFDMVLIPMFFSISFGFKLLTMKNTRLRDNESLVLSMDSRVLKIWQASTASPFASIETDCALNDFCRYPDSGLIFFANEGSRLQQFFIPALGTAPKWCYYLESITEELEEAQPAHLYDDYKFVTNEELEMLGLSKLVGTSVLRAYMHGYFLDRRLYNKAQLMTQPVGFEKYVNQKVRDLMHRERDCKVIHNTVETNQPMAVAALAILEDSRFEKLFKDEDFEVCHHGEQIKQNVLNAQKDNAAEISNEKNVIAKQSGLSYADNEDNMSHLEGLTSSYSCSSGTDEETLVEKAKKERDTLQRKVESYKRHQLLFQKKMLLREAEMAARKVGKPKRFIFHELDSTVDAQEFLSQQVKKEDSEGYMSLAEKRSTMQRQSELQENSDVFGGRSVTFSLSKRSLSIKCSENFEKKKNNDSGTMIRTANMDRKRALRKCPSKLGKP
ncbi:hypothetical protein DICVIV_03821 [Dictyocaulus viviparus]|uniref:Nucleolar protein 10 n=1 Tax=Dictyocaulus viviparus TaxID=29172 RepID=A0A0D8XZX1_DICVI|nr:hypothetical protein DICVIV_03821 [Dictyocaulus viviparus]